LTVGGGEFDFAGLGMIALAFVLVLALVVYRLRDDVGLSSRTA